MRRLREVRTSCSIQWPLLVQHLEAARLYKLSVAVLRQTSCSMRGKDPYFFCDLRSIQIMERRDIFQEKKLCRLVNVDKYIQRQNV
jgi:hypothetical protein